MNIYKYLGCLLIPLLYSQSSAAHVRWFAPNQGEFSGVYYTLDLVSVLVILGAIGYCVLCIYLSTLQKKNNLISTALFKPVVAHGIDWDLLRLSIAVLLIGNMHDNVFIAPNLKLIENYSFVVNLAQGALLVLLSFSQLLFAFILLIVSFSLPFVFGFEIAIDYIFELVAVAIAIGITTSNSSLIDRSLSRILKLDQFDKNKIARIAVRWGLGAQLLELAIHNKIMDPGLALYFLNDYPYF